MPISSAFERDGFVVAIDETNNPCASIQIGDGPRDGLMGFTGSTITVREGNFALTFDQRGNRIGSQQLEDLSSPNATGSGCLGAIAVLLVAPVSIGAAAWLAWT